MKNDLVSLKKRFDKILVTPLDMPKLLQHIDAFYCKYDYIRKRTPKEPHKPIIPYP